MARGTGENCGENLGGQLDWYPYLYHVDYEEDTGTCRYYNPNYEPKYKNNYCGRMAKGYPVPNSDDVTYGHVLETIDEGGGPITPDSTEDFVQVNLTNTDPIRGKYIQTCNEESEGTVANVFSFIGGENFTKDICLYVSWKKR